MGTQDVKRVDGAERVYACEGSLVSPRTDQNSMEDNRSIIVLLTAIQLRLSLRSPVVHDLRRLGWGEVGGTARKVGYLLAKQLYTVQGAWMQREKRGREDAEGDGDERSLAGGGSRTREAVFPGTAGRLLPKASQVLTQSISSPPQIPKLIACSKVF